MAQCWKCGADTMLFVSERPVCTTCDDDGERKNTTRDVARKPNSADERNIEWDTHDRAETAG
jgi:hypothetical protein